MTRLRPAALLLLAALPGAAWAACNPTGSILCCTPHEELECDEIEWPRADGVEGFQTDDGIVHFHLTGLPEGLTWTGTIVKTWEPVDDETECTTDPIRTPTSGSIQSIITWNIYQNGTVIASGTDIDAETAEPVSGLVRCVFSVASFADACGYDSQSYELEQNFTQAQAPVIVLDVSGGIVPRYSTDPADRPMLTCTVQALEGTTFPLTVHLSGSRIRFEPGTQMIRTITLNDTSPVPFDISGQEWSDVMNDGKIYARASSELGEVEAVADVTVLWVELAINDQYFIPDCEEFSREWTIDPDNVGASTRIQLQGHRECAGNVVLITGTVHPSNFPNTLDFERYCIGQYAYTIKIDGSKHEDPSNFVARTETEWQADTPDPILKDVDPKPSGKIYDLDTPGLLYSGLRELPPGQICHLRMNFVEYVSSVWGRASDNFYWYTRTTLKRRIYNEPSCVEFCYRQDCYPENEAGKGRTSLVP